MESRYIRLLRHLLTVAEVIAFLFPIVLAIHFTLTVGLSVTVYDIALPCLASAAGLLGLDSARRLDGDLPTGRVWALIILLALTAAGFLVRQVTYDTRYLARVNEWTWGENR